MLNLYIFLFLFNLNYIAINKKSKHSAFSWCIQNVGSAIKKKLWTPK